MANHDIPTPESIFTDNDIQEALASCPFPIYSRHAYREAQYAAQKMRLELAHLLSPGSAAPLAL